MNPPGPSPSDIQTHLYSSFLDGSTSDVALRVHGSWTAVYLLHRVVLIQSGFFRSLFTAGFMESSANRLRLRKSGSDEIDIVFDDRNITRAAFELCISRLYGGGPPLHVSPNLVPTTSRPLSPSLKLPVHDEVPPGHHPATPRFLLSLLATSLYLSIPSVTSQALSSILNTIGPYTVLQYLDFALGSPIGPVDADKKEPEAAVGLEHVARIIDDDLESVLNSIHIVNGEESRSISGSSYSLDIKEDPSLLAGAYTDVPDNSENEGNNQPLYHYGAVSDKIGEACACWLARWAVDMLAYEEDRSKSDIAMIMSRKRASTIPIGTPFADTKLSHIIPQKSFDGPVIWGRGGLSAKWVAAIVSADTLFVKGELERYEFAKSVVELRRKGGVLDDEESIWTNMFEHAIYYTNMVIEDLISIAQDISTHTHRPFVPLQVIQAAHWNHGLLRHQITFRPHSSSLVPPSSPPPRDKELGITVTTAEILTRIASPFSEETSLDNKLYFPVPRDSSSRLGDFSADAVDDSPISMEQLFHSSQPLPSAQLSLQAPGGAPSNPDKKISEVNFFGLAGPKYNAAACVAYDPTGLLRWSQYPPFRFSVEFWDLDRLKDKSRLHSHTVWYGGNLFNIYIQMVRKKGQSQLGIYVHRQSSVDPIPSPSTPSHSRHTISGVPTTRERLAHTRGPSLPSIVLPSNGSPTHYSPSIHPISRSTTPQTVNYSGTSVSPSSPTLSLPSVSSSFSVGTPRNTPTTALPIAPTQPYRDPRPAISAYFSVSCASATGSSQIRFTSAPDVFPVSQSWGWKSSSLRTEEYSQVPQDISSADGRGRETSLRATILIGLV